MEHELSWLIRSLFFYDSCDSQKILIRKVRTAALKACSVMGKVSARLWKEFGNFICLVHCCGFLSLFLFFFFHFSGRFYVT